jgi:hypothetical protein
MNGRTVTYHYCAMTQISEGLSYSHGFITFKPFDASENGAYKKVLSEIAASSNQEPEKIVILSLSVVGENP